jgi:thiamine pyrophosphokinase
MDVCSCLALEQLQKLFVVLGLGKSVDHGLGGIFDLLTCECTAEELGAFKVFTRQ